MITGLIDKRTAYEASAKVPLLMVAKGKIPAGTRFDGLVGNIDIASTVLEATSGAAAARRGWRKFLESTLQRQRERAEASRATVRVLLGT